MRQRFACRLCRITATVSDRRHYPEGGKHANVGHFVIAATADIIINIGL